MVDPLVKLLGQVDNLVDRVVFEHLEDQLPVLKGIPVHEDVGLAEYLGCLVQGLLALVVVLLEHARVEVQLLVQGEFDGVLKVDNGLVAADTEFYFSRVV